MVALYILIAINIVVLMLLGALVLGAGITLILVLLAELCMSIKNKK